VAHAIVGVTFEEAQEAVLHSLSRDWQEVAKSTDEQRSIVVGLSASGRLLVVAVAVDQEAKMRIISARPATKRERHAYEDR
jgi:uncharacterized DUF497 family protein